jgi:hypothetical protein
VTGPCSLDDILAVIERQATDDTWHDALLYDLRAAEIAASAHAGVQLIAERVKVLSAGRPRGEVGIAIPPQPALFLLGLMYTTLVKDFLTVEVLLSASQIRAWVARQTVRDSSHGHPDTNEPPDIPSHDE